MTNEERLTAAVALVLMDEKFMGNNTKVDKAIEALTPKTTVSGVFKRLQGNALGDFLILKDAGKPGYTEDNRTVRVADYVKSKFKSYMDDPKTSKEATELFNKTYPPAEASPTT
jgi:hypothetical protein